MLKLRSFLCFLLFPIFLGACTTNITPFSQKEKTSHIFPDQISKVIAPFLPAGAKWTAPKFGDNRTPFFAVDLNHDQQAEAIGLFKLRDQLGMIMIKKEGQKWKKIAQQTFVGDQFQLAGAEDLTGDVLPEIILSIQMELDAQTKVLQWNKHSLSPILDQETSATVLENLDQDKRQELIIFKKLPNMQTEIVLYKPHQHKLDIKDVKKMDGSVEMSYITVGKVQKNRQGNVADIFQGALEERLEFSTFKIAKYTMLLIILTAIKTTGYTM